MLEKGTAGVRVVGREPPGEAIAARSLGAAAEAFGPLSRCEENLVPLHVGDGGARVRDQRVVGGLPEGCHVYRLPGRRW